MKKQNRNVLARAQVATEAFWAASKNSEKTHQAYYKNIESIIDEIVIPQLPKGGRFLDVGCGNGRFTLRLAPLFSEAHGIDISGPMVEAAREAAGRSSTPHVQFSVCNFVEQPWPEGKFDVITCLGVASFVIANDAYKTLFRRLSEHLALGGVLVMRDNLVKGDKEQTRLEGREYPARYRTRRKFAKSALGVGLVPVSAICIRTTRTRAHYLTLFRRGIVLLPRIRAFFNPQSVFLRALDRAVAGPRRSAASKVRPPADGMN